MLSIVCALSSTSVTLYVLVTQTLGTTEMNLDHFQWLGPFLHISLVVLVMHQASEL